MHFFIHLTVSEIIKQKGATTLKLLRHAYISEIVYSIIFRTQVKIIYLFSYLFIIRIISALVCFWWKKLERYNYNTRICPCSCLKWPFLRYQSVKSWHSLSSSSSWIRPCLVCLVLKSILGNIYNMKMLRQQQNKRARNYNMHTLPNLLVCFSFLVGKNWRYKITVLCTHPNFNTWINWPIFKNFGI
jgi:hypothetical protein